MHLARWGNDNVDELILELNIPRGKESVIRSASEEGYWCDDFGWANDISFATRYLEGNEPTYLPISKDSDAELVVDDGSLKDFEEDMDESPTM